MIATGRQLLEARAILGISRDEMAARVGVFGTPSLKRIESFDKLPLNDQKYAAAIQDVLEKAGIEFFTDREGTPSVRLRQVLP